MYFEEKWFFILCVRLNCINKKLMTSNVDNNISDDFEEGEIVDDDSPVISQHDNYKDENHGSSERYRYAIRTKNVSDRCYNNNKNQKRILDSVKARGAANPENNRFKPTGATSINGRKRRRNYRRRGSSRLSNRNSDYLRGFGATRALLKTDSTYEEKLWDFRTRQRRNSSSKSQENEKRNKRTTISSHSEAEGSSLLKRLVGSGSLDIKRIDDNLSSGQNNCTTPTVKSNGDLVIISDDDEEQKQQTKTDNAIENPVPISKSNDEQSRILDNTNKPNAINEKPPNLHVMDDEWKLRMEALKTAVLKKHNERLKRGLVPKKISDPSDRLADSFIDDLDDIEKIIDEGNNNKDNSEKTIDEGHIDKCGSDSIINNCSDMSDDDSLRILTGSSAMEVDTTLISNDNSGATFVINEDCKNKEGDISMSDVSDDEELELRALALQSVMRKKNVEGSDTGSDNFSGNIELNKLSGEQESNNTEATTCESMRAISDTEDVDRSGNKESQNVEDWEELDEDILRAHLLKTLSSKLPEPSTSESLSTSKELTNIKVHRLSGPSSLKNDMDPEYERQCKLWSQRMVPKLIISLNESDCESEPDLPKVDFVKSLDLLLQKAKEKSEKSPSIGAKPKVKKKSISPKVASKRPLLKKSSSTPLAMKHMPIEHQEEYRRLKMKLVEKMAINSNKNSPSTSDTADIPSVVGKIDSPSSSAKNQLKKPLVQLPEEINRGAKKFKKDYRLTRADTTKSNINIVSNKEIGSPAKLKTQTFKVDNKFNKKITNSTSVERTTLKTDTKLINPTSKVSGTLTNASKLKDRLKENTRFSFKSKASLSKSNVVKDTINSKPNKQENTTQVKNNLPKIPLEKTDGSKDAVSTNRSENECADTVLIKETVPLQDLEKMQSVTIINQSLEIMDDKQDSSNLSVLLEKDIILIKSKQGDSVSSNNKVIMLDSGLKDCEGNSDKENDVIKSNKSGICNDSSNDLTLKIDTRSTPVSLGECEMTLISRLRDAEMKYEENLNLVNKLQRELEEAKKTLIERENAVIQLKQRIIFSAESPTLNVKIVDDTVHKGKTEDKQDIHKNLLKDSKCCWDPDGVLCPFELAGSCKDPLCSFHHIPKS